MSKSRSTEQPLSVTKSWKAALYIRLSREDGDSRESYSVTSQREILTQYLKQHPDIEQYDIYIDDGYSGTNFDRPGFRRMMDDVYAGNVNCVIVKDLSRFGRNYTETGKYLDDIFIRFKIRFIALNNGYDSFAGNMNSATQCVTLGVTNVINESLAATTSVNIRGTLDASRKKGEFIGSFACYGYKKDPNDRHKLIIDEEPAEVVRMIFNMFIEGKSVIGITRELNRLGIMNPTDYKHSQGLNYRANSNIGDKGVWCDQTVRRILKNEMYIGNMVQGKNTNMSYKIKKCVAVPKEDWIIVEGTHEPIIDKELFYKAQGLFNSNTKIIKGTNEIDKFAGLVKCADCHRAMGKKTNAFDYGTYVYYRCVTATKISKDACTTHSIRYDKLEEAVYITLRTLINMALDIERFVYEVEQKAEKQQRINLYQRTKDQFAGEIEKLKKHAMSLYPDWKEGILSKEEYTSLKADINEKIEALEQKIKGVEEKENDVLNKDIRKNEFIKHFCEYADIGELTRPMLVELVDSIYVHRGGSITINFKFQDAFEEALKYLEDLRRKSGKEAGLIA